MLKTFRFSTFREHVQEWLLNVRTSRVLLETEEVDQEVTSATTLGDPPSACAGLTSRLPQPMRSRGNRFFKHGDSWLPSRRGHSEENGCCGGKLVEVLQPRCISFMTVVNDIETVIIKAK